MTDVAFLSDSAQLAVASYSNLVPGSASLLSNFQNALCSRRCGRIEMTEMPTCMPARVTRDRYFTSIVSLLRTLVVGALTIAVTGCAGYVPGRQTYWDAKVKELCEKDGGITVYEQIRITPEQQAMLPKVAGSISIPPEPLVKADQPAFSVDAESVLREGDPRVVRRERTIKRLSDGRTVGRIVSYSRIGGDFPTLLSHSTSFSCPDHKKLYADQSQFFLIEGKAK